MLPFARVVLGPMDVAKGGPGGKEGGKWEIIYRSVCRAPNLQYTKSVQIFSFFCSVLFMTFQYFSIIFPIML